MSSDFFDPIYRPSLAYQHAFDWLSIRLNASEGPVAFLATSAFDGAELMRRLPAVAFLEPVPSEMPGVNTALGLPEIKAVSPRDSILAAVAWSQPNADELKQILLLKKVLRPGGRLFVIANGGLARFLVEQRMDERSKARINEREVTKSLRKHGFRITDYMGWHGVGAIAWHYLGRTAFRLGRLDWRDRCHFAMRRTFSQERRVGRIVALTGLTAERIA